MSSLVTFDLTDGIATITMDDGKANALSPAMFAELGAALDRALGDEVGAVVLAGRPGRFSAGFDLGVLSVGGDTMVDLVLSGFQMAERLLSFPRPVVIACTGHAIAMGVFLLLAGDYRVGAEGRFKITANEVAIGMTLPMAAVEMLRHRLTPAHFVRAGILAEVYSPDDAVDAGFLDLVVPEEELGDTAHTLALQFAALHRTAHAATKLRMREQALAALRAAMEADDGSLRPGS